MYTFSPLLEISSIELKVSFTIDEQFKKIKKINNFFMLYLNFLVFYCLH